MNIKIKLSYDGSRFFGSQIQPNQITVASVLYEVFNKLNIDTLLHFSGRTDRNVHATKQIISCMIPNYWSDTKKLCDTLNRMLPESIRIHSIVQVDDCFHARYSAKKRSYRYIVSNELLSPFQSSYITYHPNTINIELLTKAIEHFIGIHDFEYFSKSNGANKTTTREIFDCKIYKHKNYFIFMFQANGFLRGQIRLMMQFLFNINDGKNRIEQLIEQLEKKNLYNTKPASPNGLYLSKIIY